MRKRTGSALATACLAGVLSALTWLPAAAQQGDDNNEAPEAARYFQFEVLVFRNLDKAAQQEEKWPTQRDMKRPDNAVDLDQLVAQAEAGPAPANDGATGSAGGSDTTATPQAASAPAATGAAPTPSPAPVGNATNPAGSGSPPSPDQSGQPAQPGAAGAPAAAPTAAAATAAASSGATPAQPLPVIAPVPDGERKLDAVRRRLQRSSRYDVLYYQAWRQALTEDAPGIPYHITGGIHYGDDYELDGYLTFSLRRYLHLDADLWLTDFATGTDTGSGGWSLGGDSDNDSGWNLGSAAKDHRFRSQYYDMLSERRLVVQAAHLDEHRRMRSKQLNYLDHPLFGVLVLITPVPPPATESTPPANPDATGTQASPAPAQPQPQPAASAPSE